MAKEKVYSEVLNLRIDAAMAAEIKRIAEQRGRPESEAARMLLGWGIAAHRDMEAKMLQRPYDYEGSEFPVSLRIGVWWQEQEFEGEPMSGSRVPDE
ncbi:MAG: hypothetical protein M3R46_15080 [Actinomycetota bacterium]|nr:hypothetical protein [Actinomycetota bacterium]MDQ3092949.1 hypothetical protein [Actinomycetota bacterium]